MDFDRYIIAVMNFLSRHKTVVLRLWWGMLLGIIIGSIIRYFMYGWDGLWKNA